MSAAAIEFRNVTKTYQRIFSDERVEALSDVSFEVNTGEVCAFLGPNGAGKSTSIGILMGFHFANSGSIRVLGYEPGDVRAKEHIGFLPENFAFYRYLTGPKLLRMHRALAGEGSSGGDALIAGMLAKVKLNGYEKLKIGKYSRGMVQRLGIAQALLCNPDLVILDEPTSGLDPAGRREVLQVLAALKSEGKTVFLSSHILPEVEQICDRVIIIDHGKVVRTGKLTEMLAGGDRIDIIADRVPAEMEQAWARHGAAFYRGPYGVRLNIDASMKREVVEGLWTADCDVVSMIPVRSTLEELFLKTVDKKEAVA